MIDSERLYFRERIVRILFNEEGVFSCQVMAKSTRKNVFIFKHLVSFLLRQRLRAIFHAVRFVSALRVKVSRSGKRRALPEINAEKIRLLNPNMFDRQRPH